jgi:hypothetical protein
MTNAVLYIIIQIAILKQIGFALVIKFYRITSSALGNLSDYQLFLRKSCLTFSSFISGAITAKP